MSATVVYLSGPMTGIADFNFPAFANAAAAWREAGFDVRSPHEAFGGDKTRAYAEYIREDVRMMLDCTAIAMLPGWEASRGARMELHLAQMMGFDVYRAADFTPLDAPALAVIVPPPPGATP